MAEPEITPIVLARVESEDSVFPAEERLTAEMFRQMVANYDPESRPAPVISGFHEGSGTAGPGHSVGEYTPPLGFVRSLSFDGLNLWGEVEEVQGRVTDAVRDGFHQRSIAFWRHHPEVKGQPYLRHVALLGGEPPGIPNMPPLTEYFEARHGIEGRHLSSMPYETRSILDRPFTINAGEAREGVTMDEDLKNEMRTFVGELFSEFRKVLVEALPKADTLAETRAASGEPDLGPEDRPVTAADLRSLTEHISTLTAQATEAISATRAIREESRSEKLTSRLDLAVRSGKLSPAERENEEKFLRGISDLGTPEARTLVDERLGTIESRSPQLGTLTSPANLRQRVAPDSDQTINLRRYTLPRGKAAGVVDQRELAIVKSAKAKAGDNYAKFRAEVYAAAGEFSGEDL